MTNLEIVRSTYEGKNSEANGRNLAAYAAQDIAWTEAKGFPYGGTYTGLDAIGKNVFRRLATEWTDYTFTPEGYVTEYPVPTANSGLQFIAVDGNDQVWFTEAAGNKIGRLTFANDVATITEFEIPTPGSVPQAIAVAPDGNLWFTE